MKQIIKLFRYSQEKKSETWIAKFFGAFL